MTWLPLAAIYVTMWVVICKYSCSSNCKGKCLGPGVIVLLGELGFDLTGDPPSSLPQEEFVAEGLGCICRLAWA